jgi:predicted amidophosphoribosyltransferase
MVGVVNVMRCEYCKVPFDDASVAICPQCGAPNSSSEKKVVLTKEEFAAAIARGSISRMFPKVSSSSAPWVRDD